MAQNLQGPIQMRGAGPMFPKSYNEQSTSAQPLTARTPIDRSDSPAGFLQFNRGDRFGADYDSLYEEDYIASYYATDYAGMDREGDSGEYPAPGSAEWDVEEDGEEGFGAFYETLKRHTKLFSRAKEFLAADVKSFAVYQPPASEASALKTLASNPAAWGAVDALLIPLSHLSKPQKGFDNASTVTGGKVKGLFTKVKQGLSRAMSSNNLQAANSMNQLHAPTSRSSSPTRGSAPSSPRLGPAYPPPPPNAGGGLNVGFYPTLQHAPYADHNSHHHHHGQHLSSRGSTTSLNSYYTDSHDSNGMQRQPSYSGSLAAAAPGMKRMGSRTRSQSSLFKFMTGGTDSAPGSPNLDSPGIRRVGSVAGSEYALSEYDYTEHAYLRTVKSLLKARVQHLIAIVDLEHIHDLYKSTIVKATSFADFVNNYLGSKLEACVLPISGFYFVNAWKLHGKVSKLKRIIVKMVKALRTPPKSLPTSSSATNLSTSAQPLSSSTPPSTTTTPPNQPTFRPPVVLMDTFGLHLFDQLRDHINGFLLQNLILDPTTSTQKIRSRDTLQDFEDRMKLLKAERAIRMDFVVLGAECLEPHGPLGLSHAMMRYAMNWYKGMGFVMWICSSEGMGLLEDVKGPLYTELGSDMLEMATDGDVVRVRKLIEGIYIHLVEETGGLMGGGISVTPETWENLLGRARFPFQFLNAMQGKCFEITERNFEGVVYCRRPYPKTGLVAQEFKDVDMPKFVDLSKAYSAAGVIEKVTNPQTPLEKEQGFPVVLSYFGESYGEDRIFQVGSTILGVLLELKAKNLLAAFRYNVDLGKDPNKFSAGFQQCVDVLTGMIESPSPVVLWLQTLLFPSQRSTLQVALRQLLSDLKEDKVSVWMGTKASFILQEKKSLPSTPVWGIFVNRGNQDLVFVSDDCPCVEEVLLHVWMKAVYGWNTGTCLLLEAMVNAQLSKLSLEVPVPARFKTQIDGSCKSELLSYIRKTEPAVQYIKSLEGHEISAGAAAYSLYLCRFVSARAEHILLELESYTDMMTRWSNDAYQPKNDLEALLIHHLGTLALSKTGLSQLQNLAKTFEKTAMAMLNDPFLLNELYALCYLYMAMVKAMRRCAYLELESSILCMCSQFLRDKDQVAVTLEMSTTQTNLQEIFHLSSLQLASSFHRRVRTLLKADEEEGAKPNADLEKRTVAVNRKFDSGMGKQLGNSYIYIYPILVDLILSNLIGSGIFFSNRMNTVTLNAGMIAFVISFPFIGAIMNSIGRSISLYYYQKSNTLMIMGVSHRLAGSVLVLFIVGLMVGLTSYFLYWDPVVAVGSFLYSYIFGVFMLFYAVLCSFRETDVYPWKSPGPATCIQALFMLIPPAIISKFAFKDESQSMLVWGIYGGTLLVTTIFMAYRYTHIVKAYLDWPNKVKVASKAEIEAHYIEKGFAKPVKLEDESQDAFDKRMRRWERSATEWYSVQTARRIRVPGFRKDPFVSKRADQWLWEQSLMKWYMERSSIMPGSVITFSPEWDNIVRQAVGDLQKKYQLEKLNRGVLLFELESPAIVFGFIYFIIIFLDKWAMLIATRTLSNNSPISLQYNQGLSLGTVFLLIAAGFLELTLQNCTAKMKTFKYKSIADVEDPKILLKEYMEFLASIYKSELKLLALRSLGVFVITTAATLGIGWNDETRVVYIVYGLSVFAYTGLLVGLFNKIFIQNQEWKLNLYLIVGSLLSLAGSAAMIRYFGIIWAISSTVLGCWIFGIACIITRYLEKVGTPHYDIPITPNISSSGQRSLGYDSNFYTRTARDALTSKLMKNLNKMDIIAPRDGLGGNVLQMLQKFLSVSNAMPSNHLVAMGLQDIKHIVEKTITDFSSGALLVYHVEKVLEAEGVLYKALAVRTEAQNIVFVSYTVNDTLNGSAIPIVCEALLHETAEIMGFPHTVACAIECMLAMVVAGGNVSLALPMRMARQVASAERSEQEKLWLRTEQNIEKLSRLCIDVDELWPMGSGMTVHDRAFFVYLAKIWPKLQHYVCDGKIQAASALVEEISSNAPPSFYKLLQRARSKPFSLPATISQCLILTAVAVNIRNNCVVQRQSFTLRRKYDTLMVEQAEKINDPWGRVLFHIAILYLALTADPSFGREATALSAFTRVIYGAIFKLCKFFFNGINFMLIYRYHSTIMELLRRPNNVIWRYKLIQSKTSLYRVDFNSMTTGLVNLETKPEEERPAGMLELLRYEGSKPAAWEPKKDEKPFARATFAKINASEFRLTHEHIFDKAAPENVKRTHIYNYASSKTLLPQIRYVYDQDIPVFVKGTDNVARSVVEVHHFNRGMVNKATFKRLHKITKRPMTIEAVYKYKSEGPGIKTATAIYTCTNSEDPFELFVEYAPSYEVGTMPKIWTIEYHKRSQTKIFRTKYDYSHPKHVVTATVLVNHMGENQHLDNFGTLFMHTKVPTPAEIEHDYYGILTMMPPLSIFESSEMLVDCYTPHKVRSYHLAWPYVRLQQINYSSSYLDVLSKRTRLWTEWRNNKIPGIFARDLDERILRTEPALHEYWRCRDRGDIVNAQKVLVSRKKHLDNSLYVSDKPTTRTRLQIRYSDLYVLGIGGETSHIASFDQKENMLAAADDEKADMELLNVICLDSGTWPTGGGGVGSCRRDLIDQLQSIRWTAVAEVATTELEQKDYQIERNINQLIYVPIFDADFCNPHENISRHDDYHKMCHKVNSSTDKVIRTIFAPMVVRLIHACMTEDIFTDRALEYESIFIELHKYFKKHDWSVSWNHQYTQRMWIKTYIEISAKHLAQRKILKKECPTLEQIGVLFSLFSRLLLPLALEIPKVPVVHVSHHGTQAILGVLAKALYGSRLIIWDHGMLWRERLFGLCQDALPGFVQTGFIGLTRLCTRLAYLRADYVTPCTSVQNVMWAAWLAGGKWGNDKERAQLIRRCSPALNGMDVSKFSVNRSLAMKTPSAVMLSHISPVKDVMNAIKAAYYIVHEFKLTSYVIHIYGSPEKDQNYTLACKGAISEFNLEKNVFIKGLGSPGKVLPTGWIFVNSSITEGLPLALGEAGLCGLPVVCTDVGGSREVISDKKTGAIYGAVVPPSRPRQLAIGQLQVFAMTDGLEQLVDPDSNTPVITFQSLVDAGPEALEERIMNPRVMELREKLGIMLRNKVLDIMGTCTSLTTPEGATDAAIDNHHHKTLQSANNTSSTATTLEFIHSPSQTTLPTGPNLIRLTTSQHHRSPHDYVVLNSTPTWTSPPAFFNYGKETSLTTIHIPSKGKWWLLYYSEDKEVGRWEVDAVEPEVTLVPILRVSPAPQEDAVPPVVTKKFKTPMHPQYPLRNPGTGFMNIVQTYTLTFDATQPHPPSPTCRRENSDPCIWWIIAFNNHEADSHLLPDLLLSNISNVLKSFEEAGKQVFIRFFYTKPGADSLSSEFQDPSDLSHITSHMAQLSTILKSHRRAIAGLNAGMLGAFGEWHHSNLGEIHEIPPDTEYLGQLSYEHTEVLERYYRIIEEWMTHFPQREDPTIYVRRWFYKKLLLLKLEENKGSTETIQLWKDRISVHLDALLSSDDDSGTYMDAGVEVVEYGGVKYTLTGAKERKAQKLDSETNPTMGETCLSSRVRYGPEAALAEFSQYHLTAINRLWHPDIVKSWTSGSYETVAGSLGYRWHLEEVSVQQLFDKDDDSRTLLSITLHIRNFGFSSSTNNKFIYLRLVPTENVESVDAPSLPHSSAFTSLSPQDPLAPIPLHHSPGWIPTRQWKPNGALTSFTCLASLHKSIFDNHKALDLVLDINEPYIAEAELDSVHVGLKTRLGNACGSGEFCFDEGKGWNKLGVRLVAT
ncbi:hypothetical protein HDV05_005534 [Chytridiales sp. JEL 0842]|nr:hypothetical protein HDV05_005534 [Chytridiales sp. JEL 0842]